MMFFFIESLVPKSLMSDEKTKTQLKAEKHFTLKQNEM